ncbi:MAG: glycosyltransferase family 39 protein [Candidatus Eremiobacteraeota bacterium]|nr:glycosyltransferase family 39 protein [Candidatus Eremiobacteraeota bacterium]
MPLRTPWNAGGPLAAALALLTLLRLIGAWRTPLGGDEAYYWEWSRHLAGGYVDHPPLVAYVIWRFSWRGATPFAVRLPFVICGIIAPVFAAMAAAYIAQDRRAALPAGLAVALAPILSLAFATAVPDGPYLAAWTAALYFAARAFREGKTRWYLLLGICVGLTLLSRLFGFALVIGTLLALRSARPVAPQRLWISAMLAALIILPFLLWNAAHGWSTFAFSILGRHAGHAMALRPLTLQLSALIAFSPGLYAAALYAPARVRTPLLLWSALPLGIGFTLLAFKEPVEVYWFDASYVTLAIAAGIAYNQLSPKPRRIWSTLAVVPAILLLVLVFGATIVPDRVYGLVQRFGVHLSDNGAFEIFTYNRLAHDVKRITEQQHAIAMTDGYGFSSALDFYAGVTPWVIGYDTQGQEAKRWLNDAMLHERRALFIDKVPLETRPDFVIQLHRACGMVRAGPKLTYSYEGATTGIAPRTYHTTWCYNTKPAAIRTLRWQHGS